MSRTASATTRTRALRSSRSRRSRSTSAWLEIVLLAHDLIVWAQALLLDGELAKAEPKRLRYRLLYVAGRLAFHGRRGKLRLQHDWPWAAELLAAFQKLKTLPPASR